MFPKPVLTQRNAKANIRTRVYLDCLRWSKWDKVRNWKELRKEILKKLKDKKSYDYVITLNTSPQLISTMSHMSIIRCVTYFNCKTGLIFLTHNSNGLNHFINLFVLYPKAGTKRQARVQVPWQINNIIYVKEPQVFVFFGTEGLLRTFYLCGNDPVESSNCRSWRTVLCMTYITDTKEVVCGCIGSVEAWLIDKEEHEATIYKGRTFHVHLKKFDWTSDLKVDVKSQLLMVVVERAIFILNYKENVQVCVIENVMVETASFRCCCFYNHGEYVLAGSGNGLIKVWSLVTLVRIHEFRGHRSCVTALHCHRKEPLIFSSSLDGTVQIWRMDNFQRYIRIDIGEKIMSMDLISDVEIVCQTDKELKFYYLHHFYIVFSYMESRVLRLIRFEGKLGKPNRILCSNEDGSFHLLSVISGNVGVAFYPLPFNHTLKEFCYNMNDEILYAVLSEGSVLVIQTQVNPATAIHVLRSPIYHERVTSLCLCQLRMKKLPDTVVLAGLINGQMMLIDGKVTKLHTFQAHHGAITFMEVLNDNEMSIMGLPPEEIFLATASKSQEIRFWKIELNPEEIIDIDNPEAPPRINEDCIVMTFHLLQTFYCGGIPKHICFNKNVIALAYEGSGYLNLFKIVPNEVKQTNNWFSFEFLNHSVDDDHIDEVTVICGCPQVEIFASGSLDGTVKIWDMDSVMIREIHFGYPVTAVCFLNSRSDLLIGVNNYVMMVSCLNYLPFDQLYKLANIPIVDDMREIFIYDDYTLDPRSNIFAIVPEPLEVSRQKISVRKVVYLWKKQRESERKLINVGRSFKTIVQQMIIQRTLKKENKVSNLMFLYAMLGEEAALSALKNRATMISEWTTGSASFVQQHLQQFKPCFHMKSTLPGEEKAEMFRAPKKTPKEHIEETETAIQHEEPKPKKKLKMKKTAADANECLECLSDVLEKKKENLEFNVNDLQKKKVSILSDLEFLKRNKDGVEAGIEHVLLAIRKETDSVKRDVLEATFNKLTEKRDSYRSSIRYLQKKQVIIESNLHSLQREKHEVDSDIDLISKKCELLPSRSDMSRSMSNIASTENLLRSGSSIAMSEQREGSEVATPQLDDKDVTEEENEEQEEEEEEKKKEEEEERKDTVQEMIRVCDVSLLPWDLYLLNRKPIVAPDGYIPNSIVRKKIKWKSPTPRPTPTPARWEPLPLPEGDDLWIYTPDDDVKTVSDLVGSDFESSPIITPLSPISPIVEEPKKEEEEETTEKKKKKYDERSRYISPFDIEPRTGPSKLHPLMSLIRKLAAEKWFHGDQNKTLHLSLEELLKLLAVHDRNLHRQVCDYIIEFNKLNAINPKYRDKFVTVLRKQLHLPTPFMRQDSLRTLRELVDRNYHDVDELVNAILPLLFDPDEHVKVEAILTLRKFTGLESEEELIALMKERGLFTEGGLEMEQDELEKVDSMEDRLLLTRDETSVTVLKRQDTWVSLGSEAEVKLPDITASQMKAESGLGRPPSQTAAGKRISLEGEPGERSRTAAVQSKELAKTRKARLAARRERKKEETATPRKHREAVSEEPTKEVPVLMRVDSRFRQKGTAELGKTPSQPTSLVSLKLTPSGKISREELQRAVKTSGLGKDLIDQIRDRLSPGARALAEELERETVSLSPTDLEEKAELVDEARERLSTPEKMKAEGVLAGVKEEKEISDISEKEKKGVLDISGKKKEGILDTAEKERKGILDISEKEKEGVLDISEKEKKGVLDISEKEKEGVSDISEKEKEGVLDISEKETEGVSEITEEKEEDLDSSKKRKEMEVIVKMSKPRRKSAEVTKRVTMHGRDEYELGVRTPSPTLSLEGEVGTEDELGSEDDKAKEKKALEKFDRLGIKMLKLAMASEAGHLPVKQSSSASLPPVYSEIKKTVLPHKWPGMFHKPSTAEQKLKQYLQGHEVSLQEHKDFKMGHDIRRYSVVDSTRGPATVPRQRLKLKPKKTAKKGRKTVMEWTTEVEFQESEDKEKLPVISVKESRDLLYDRDQIESLYARTEADATDTDEIKVKRRHTWKPELPIEARMSVKTSEKIKEAEKHKKVKEAAKSMVKKGKEEEEEEEEEKEDEEEEEIKEEKEEKDTFPRLYVHSKIRQIHIRDEEEETRQDMLPHIAGLPQYRPTREEIKSSRFMDSERGDRTKVLGRGREVELVEVSRVEKEKQPYTRRRDIYAFPRVRIGGSYFEWRYPLPPPPANVSLSDNALPTIRTAYSHYCEHLRLSEKNMHHYISGDTNQSALLRYLHLEQVSRFAEIVSSGSHCSFSDILESMETENVIEELYTSSRIVLSTTVLHRQQDPFAGGDLYPLSKTGFPKTERGKDVFSGSYRGFTNILLQILHLHVYL